MFLSFAPWILFWVLNSHHSFREAVIAGLVASAILVGWESLRSGGSPKILNIGTVVWFAVLTGLAFMVDDEWLARWTHPLSNAALALIALGSILVGRPFTLHYAEEDAPRQVWDTPAFRRTNTIISWVWVAAFAVMTVSSVLTTEYPERERFFSWLIPIGAFILAVAFTREYSAAVQRRMHAEQAVRRSS